MMGILVFADFCITEEEESFYFVPLLSAFGSATAHEPAGAAVFLLHLYAWNTEVFSSTHF